MYTFIYIYIYMYIHIYIGICIYIHIWLHTNLIHKPIDTYEYVFTCIPMIRAHTLPFYWTEDRSTRHEAGSVKGKATWYQVIRHLAILCISVYVLVAYVCLHATLRMRLYAGTYCSPPSPQVYERAHELTESYATWLIRMCNDWCIRDERHAVHGNAEEGSLDEQGDEWGEHSLATVT